MQELVACAKANPGELNFGSPKMKKKFAALGADLTTSNPEECGAFVRSELAVWGKMMADVGITRE